MPHLQNNICFMRTYHTVTTSPLITFIHIPLLALMCYAHAHFHAHFYTHIVPATCMHTVTQQPHSHSFPFFLVFFLSYLLIQLTFYFRLCCQSVHGISPGLFPLPSDFIKSASCICISGTKSQHLHPRVTCHFLVCVNERKTVRWQRLTICTCSFVHLFVFCQIPTDSRQPNNPRCFRSELRLLLFRNVLLNFKTHSLVVVQGEFLLR